MAAGAADGKEQAMSRVRVLVGTRKGAFVIGGDGKRDRWDVSGPYFGGWEIYHLKGSPANPDRLYASQSSAWFGQVIQRSDDAGKTWESVGNKFAYDGPTGTHLWYDGTPHPWDFARVWHLEPSATDPDTVLAGVEDAALFRTTDGGRSWHPMNKGLVSEQIPNPTAEVGHCVHRVAMHRTRPDTLFMQKHWDVMRSDDAGETWREVSGNLPTDFGFPIDVHAHEPETIYVVPIKSDSEHYPPDGKLRVYRSRTGGHEWEALTNGLPQSHCYVNVLRDAMAIDALDPCGIYFGTTGGQVYGSADGGDHWAPIVRDLPSVVSVEVQTLS
jgi:photosystem II stability/assembly factor-like uncharacterized protein